MATSTSPRLRPGSSASYLGSIADGDSTSPEVITKTLTDAFAAEGYSDCIKDLPRVDIDPQSFIDGLDKVGSRLSYPHILLFTAHWLPGNRHYFSRIRYLRTMRSSVEEDMWHIRATPRFSYSRIGPNTRPTARRAWWFLRCLEG